MGDLKIKPLVSVAFAVVNIRIRPGWWDDPSSLTTYKEGLCACSVDIKMADDDD